METNIEDGDIVYVEIDTGRISFDEDSNMRYDRNTVVGGYGLTNGGVGGLIHEW